MKVRDAMPDDAAGIADIYNVYVLTDTATFEEDAVPDARIAERIEATQGDGYDWLIAESDGGQVLGYAYSGRWMVRAASIGSRSRSASMSRPACKVRAWVARCMIHCSSAYAPSTTIQ